MSMLILDKVMSATMGSAY